MTGEPNSRMTDEPNSKCALSTIGGSIAGGITGAAAAVPIANAIFSPEHGGWRIVLIAIVAFLAVIGGGATGAAVGCWNGKSR